MKQQVLEETFEKILKKEPELLHVEIDEEYIHIYFCTLTFQQKKKKY